MSFLASSFIWSTAFRCLCRFFSMKSFYSYRKRCSRSSALRYSSSMCFGRSFIGVASTVALRTCFFLRVISYGVNVQPCNSFFSRSSWASFSLFSYRARRYSISYCKCFSYQALKSFGYYRCKPMFTSKVRYE